VVTQLLASRNETDIVSAIEFLVSAVEYNLDGSDEAARRMLPLVFAPVDRQASRNAVYKAISEIYLSDRCNLHNCDNLPRETKVAINLIDLALRSNLGEISAVEKVLDDLLRSEENNQPVLGKDVLEAVCFEGINAMNKIQKTSGNAIQVACGAFLVLSMMAAARPDVVAENLENVVLKGLNAENCFIRRFASLILKNMSTTITLFYQLKEDEKACHRGVHNHATILRQSAK
jgi:condensin complex subunit 1